MSALFLFWSGAFDGRLNVLAWLLVGACFTAVHWAVFLTLARRSAWERGNTTVSLVASTLFMLGAWPVAVPMEVAVATVAAIVICCYRVAGLVEPVAAPNPEPYEVAAEREVEALLKEGAA